MIFGLPSAVDSVRLDIWLDVACLFRTRSEAQKACKAGKIEVNGQPAKPHREVRPGDEVVISRPMGRKQRLAVYGLADRHIARADARALYEDLTPPPTPEEIELRRMARLVRPFVRPAGAGAPDKRERRSIRRFKEGS
jgi:ribosome-associated heat shock protein Hsp15